jgi:hypothetical protein
MHRNAVRDPQIRLDAKTQDCRNVSQRAFCQIIQVPLEHEKECRRFIYMTHISHWMQKHKFGVACTDALFMETTLASLKQEK